MTNSKAAAVADMQNVARDPRGNMQLSVNGALLVVGTERCQ